LNVDEVSKKFTKFTTKFKTKFIMSHPHGTSPPS